MTTATKQPASSMAQEETMALIKAMVAKLDDGDEEGAFEFARQIPLAPELAMCFATQAGLGPEALKSSGLNLTDAEAVYGTDWLERV